MLGTRVLVRGGSMRLMALMLVLALTAVSFSAVPASAAGPYTISEMMYNPPGTDGPNEYVELRGTANETIPAGTYLLGIEGDPAGAGDVQTIFNLSGLTFGSNGFLVLRQFNSPYTTDPGATVVTSTATGWSGLGIFSSDSGQTDIENSSVTFLLMQSATAPTLTDDIDADNDGTPDGAVYAGWTILDGIGLLNGGATDTAYAVLVFSSDGAGLVPSGAAVVNTGFDPQYAGRIGTSTGDTASDWMVGVSLDGTAPNFTLDPVTTLPITLAGEPLDNVGSANGAPLSPVINEFSWSHTGTDTNEYMEVYAEPNTDLSTLTLVIIEGDSGSTLGNLVRAVPVGTTDASGFWWTGFVATDTFQNGSQTGLLVEGFSGTIGTDLDTNNDGTLDSTPWTNILDGVAVNDNAATDKTYTPVVLLPNYDGLSIFIPGGASRIPNGTDTDAVADWVRNDFELAGIPGFTGTLVAGEALNTPGTVNLTTPADVLPTVSSTSPLDNAVDVAIDTNVTITFSEPVSVTDPWFTFSCTTSGSVTPSVSGGPTTFTLDPASNLALNETCTITVTAAQVADQDGTPDAMAADYTFDFTTTAVEVCSTPFTPIYTLQEAGSNFGLAGTFTVEGIVTGDFQNDNQLDGFFLQDATGDGNPVTSDGIFVFDDQPLLADVVVGQRVRVTGTVSEFTPVSASATQTRITPTQIVSCGDTGAITTVSVTLPFADSSFAERYESMRVNVAQTLYVTEVFSVGRFGQVGLSSGARLENPTNEVLPGAPANAMAAANDLNYLVLDDGNQRQNPDPAPYLFGPEPTLRNGDRTTDLTGILTYMDASPDATTSAEATGFRLYPTLPVTFTRDNPRPTAPVNSGTLRVISFNVLNYFNGDGVGGGFPTSRGASTALEFQRQSDKIVAAIDALDPAIAGLIEIENDTGALSALADLVSRLNAVAGAGTYAYVETGVVGTDEIKVAFIYQPAIVTPVGTPLVDLNAIHNRPPVVQLFEQISTGARFNVVVNHFKSKGCDGATGLDLDQGDGQSCFNARRVQQAQRLITFLTTTVIPQSGDQDVLIIGDLNAYLKEDPIAALEGAGYTNLTTTYISDPYSYLFDGEYGTLDHALATASMAAQVHDVNEWHINADEPIVLDYNMEFKSDAQDLLNVGTPYRSSDHDPIVVDLGALTPEEALLSLQLTLEARSNPAPHPSYVVTANVKIAPQGGGPVFFDQDFVSNTSGVLVVDADLAPGSYTLTVKGSHTLARQFDVTVVVGNNNIPTPLLAEGDATDDNIVNISDFSVLAFAFGTSPADANYDARADFNGDSLVNISDFSLLATHWAETGDGGVGP